MSSSSLAFPALPELMNDFIVRVITDRNVTTETMHS